MELSSSGLPGQKQQPKQAQTTLFKTSRTDTPNSLLLGIHSDRKAKGRLLEGQKEWGRNDGEALDEAQTRGNLPGGAPLSLSLSDCSQPARLQVRPLGRLSADLVAAASQQMRQTAAAAAAATARRRPRRREEGRCPKKNTDRSTPSSFLLPLSKESWRIMKWVPTPTLSTDRSSSAHAMYMCLLRSDRALSHLGRWVHVKRETTE